MRLDLAKTRRAVAFAALVAVTSGCSHATTSDGTASPPPVETAAAAAAPATATATATATAQGTLSTAASAATAANASVAVSSGDFDAGPATFDDTIVVPEANVASGGAGAGAVSAGSNAAGLLSSDSGPAPAASAATDPLEAAARKVSASLPPSEYSLDALVPTLPADPAALDAYVRDNIGLDLYDGVVRGALGAWLGRAANPLDKTLLLAAALHAKNVPFAFVHGTLSDIERAAIVNEADGAKPFAIESQDARQQAYLATRIAAGRRFAAWIKPILGTSVAAPDEATSPDHYWIRTTGTSRSIDLDPTLKTTAPGTHLGTEDTSTAPAPALPAALYATVDIRVRATAATGAQTTIVKTNARVADIGLAPVSVTIVPGDAGTNATLLVGAHVAASNPVPAGVSELDLDVVRTTAGGTSSTISRRIFDGSGASPSSTSASVHTIVLCAESAPAFFAHVAFDDATVLARANAIRRAGQTPGELSLYPELLADYLASDDAVAAALDAQGFRLYRDRPGVVMLHATITPSGATGADVATTFDIGDNGMAAAGTRATEVDANLARGWADTRIEKDIMEARGGDAMDAWLGAKSQHAQFSVATSATTPTSFPAGVEVAQSGAADGHAFWWDVDATTGSAVGRQSGGFGEAAAGYAVHLRTAVNGITTFYEVGSALYGIYSTAKTCLTSVVSAACGLGVLGVVSTGYGALGFSQAAKAGGRVGKIVTGMQYFYSTLPPDYNKPYPDANAPNSCGMVCAPGDPAATDGDGP